MRRSLLASMAILAVVLAVGCAADGESIGAIDQELTQADSIVEPTNTGIVEFINSNGGCSGTLVRNQWVLSAAHCWAGGWDQVAGAFVRMGGQAAWVQKAFPVSYLGVIDAATDAMLLKLDRPLAMNGSTSGWRRNLTPVVVSLLNQTQLGCWGYGINDFGTVDHKLRLTNDEFMNGWDSGNVVLRRNGGQHIQNGDSGGPCLYFDGTIVGVIHGHEILQNGTFGPDQITPSDRFTFWFEPTIANN